MIALPAGSMGIAMALAVAAGCGGGGGKASTTTSAPSSSEATTATSVESTTTTRLIDPALRALLLVASDLPGFKDPTSLSPVNDPSTSCDATQLPGVKAIIEASAISGPTIVKGANDAVKVSSRVISTTPDQAQGGLTELLDPKAASCLESDLRKAVDSDQPAGTTVTLKLASSQSTVAGAEQTVILAGTATVKGDTVTRTLRFDLGFVRSGGTVLIITYSGASSVTSVTERQGIIVIAASKLNASTAGATATTVAGTGKSTSSTRRTSTTKRSGATTTVKATTTSTTKMASTTSTTKAP